MQVTRLISNHLESNTFVVSDNGQSLIVDSGAEVEDVIAAVGDNKVVGVLLTHGHFDHAFNSTEYAKTFGCKIYVNENAKEVLPDAKKNYGEDFSISDFSNFEFLKGDMSLKLGQFQVEVLWIPGHSACQTGFLIGKDLFVGDCMFHGGIGRMDLVTSRKDKMVGSLQKLNNVSYDVCHSGHGRDTEETEMKRSIDTYIKFLSR